MTSASRVHSKDGPGFRKDRPAGPSRPEHRPALLLAAVLFLLVAAPGVGLAQPDCSQDTRTVALPDPVSGRQYEIQVSLPDGFADHPDRLWPLVILADGGRAFPHLSCIGRRLAREAAITADPVIVGLSYAAGEDFENSRRRDYTPVPRAGSRLAYGGATAYQGYLRDVVLPHVETAFRTDPGRRLFWGHSYGGLLGAHILLTAPQMFQTYMLGSASFWYEDGAIHAFEDAYAARHTRLEARVLLYVGGQEVSRYDRARKGHTRDMVAGMQAFEARLRGRNYEGLRLASAVMAGRDHRSAVRPGFEWALSGERDDGPGR